MATFTMYDGSDAALLTSAIVALGSGVVIDTGSILLDASGAEAVNFYDGSLAPLGIGAGLLLTSGHAPGTVNTVPWDGQDNSGTTGFYNGDPDIDAVVNTVFQTQSYDATTLSFGFTVTDPTATSITFDLVIGTDEYPEWVDQFVDCAVVMVNGVNHALFNHDPLHPLSVITSNLAAGYFQDNQGGALPIEYDGVSHVLKIVAPIQAGVNTLKIGIADTGDHIYDSGLFIANLSAGTTPGSGVVSPGASCDDAANTVTGSTQAEYFDLKGGDDVAYAGGGDDIVVAGSGNDAVYGGSGADQLEGDAGDDVLDGGEGQDTAVYAGAWAGGAGTFTLAAAGAGWTLTDTSGAGSDTLASIELVKFSDGTYALGPGGLTPVTDPGPGPTNAPGLLFISGIGAPGQTLTASLSDADGVPAGVTYTWYADGVSLGTTGAQLAVGAELTGHAVSVSAAYTDAAGHAELVDSAPKSILEPGDGDFTIVLLDLQAPPGAIVENPLTTLVQNAIQTGVSPAEAMSIVKSALNLTAADIGADVDLLHYDSWEVLQANSDDEIALAVEKKLVQVAVMTSLGGDDTGMTLTQAILLAHASGAPLDLTDEGVIANVLGIDPPNPALVHEIQDRNANIQEASTVADIDTEWLDMQSGLDVVLSPSIGDLSVHVNQAPTGFATASLAAGTEDVPYTVTAAALLQGFADADGDPLQVVGLAADSGAVTGNGDGTFTITLAPAYHGPVELTYSVTDGLGFAPGSQLVIIEHVNGDPTGVSTAVLAAGLEDVPYTVSAAQLLEGFVDPDGDPLTVAGLLVPSATVVDNGDGTFTIQPPLNLHGEHPFAFLVTDGQGGSVWGQNQLTLAAVNDAPTGEIQASGMPFQGFTLHLSQSLADVDGLGPLSYQWKADGVDIAGATGETYQLTHAEVGKLVTVTASYVDGDGTAESVTSPGHGPIASLNTPPSGEVVIDGDPVQGHALTASNTLADPDGIGLVDYQWQADGADVAGATGASFTLTQAEVGKAISVIARYVDLAGTPESVASAATDPVANVDDEATGTLAVTGTAAEGGSLTATLSALSDADGATTTAYRWQAQTGGGWVDLAGQTDATLSIPDDQSYVGLTVRAVAVTTDALGGTTGFEGGALDIANVNDAPTGAVSIGGVPVPGYALTAAHALADEDGLGPVAYQWQRDGADIAGATGESYTVAGADAGRTITVRASYTDGHGTPESVVSEPAAVVAGVVGTDGADVLRGGAGDDMLFGMGGADRLTGGAGGDVLDGGTGVDVLCGGAGDDLYVVESALDETYESPGAGHDTVISLAPQYGLWGNVEDLILGPGARDGTGNRFHNALVGNDEDNVLSSLAGDDVLSGGGGADTLVGGAGNDTLTGGGGADVFRFDQAGPSANVNFDTILDFGAEDTIQLENAIYKVLKATGALSASNFAANAAGVAVDGNDYIVYDTDSGVISYDLDGSGCYAPIPFAVLFGAPALDASDFVVT